MSHPRGHPRIFEGGARGQPCRPHHRSDYATEDDPEARIRAPLVEGPDYEPDHTGPQIVAHPAATAIAIVLQRLNRAIPIARAIVHIFEPASERGKAGIEELQQQTVNLFSFQPLPKKVFDAQVAFTMLAQLGRKRRCRCRTSKSGSSAIWPRCWNAATAFRCLRCG